MFFRLDSLMQAVAPLTSLHDTSCLLVHNLHLAVHYDILVVLVEHGVCLEQLLQGVNALALHAVVAEQFVLLCHLLLVAHLLSLEFRHLCGDVRQHEEFAVVNLLCQPVGTFIGKVNAVQFLVNNEVEWLYSLRHVAVVVLHVVFFGLQHTCLDAFLREILDERLALRQRLMRAIESEEAFFEFLLSLLVALFNHLSSFCNELLCISKILRGQFSLNIHKTFNKRLVFLEHLVAAIRHRTRDDERCAGIVDEHRVNLIDDGIVVTSLHKVGRADGHIVTKVVETEFVVCSEGYVSLICLAPFGRVRLMLVDAIYRKTVEHIERSHPLGVTFGKVIVHRYDVNSIACKGVEEYRQGGNEGLTFTGCHLGNLSLMKNDTSEELHIIVHHVPLEVVTACHPVVLVYRFVAFYTHKVFCCGKFAVEIGGSHHNLLVLGKASGGLFHDTESHRHHVVKRLLVNFEDIFLQFIYLVEYCSTLVNGRCFYLSLEFSNLCFLFFC